jgi:hypothetical protein
MPKTLEMTRSLALADLRELANAEGPCITFYLPLEPAPNTSRVELVRLKSAIRMAEQKLTDQVPGVPQAKVRELIDSLRQVEVESETWGGEGGSLVVFRSPEVFRAFEVRSKLNETVVVGDFFHAFPLIRPLQLSEQRFYILALSQKNVRLLRCTATTSQQIDLPPETPTDLEDWLNTRMPNAAPDHGQRHESEIGSTEGSFTSTHDRDKKDEHIANFFRVINKAVFDLLRDEKAPLILCGVEYERSMYKGINQYPHVLEEGIQGSAESLKGPELHARALELVQNHFAEPARRAIELWEKLGGSQRVSSSFPDIVTASFQARIAHLFAAEGAQAMGAFDRSTLQMSVNGPQHDLVNAAALQTLAFGGDVFILNPDHMPGGGQINAIFRF